MLLSGWNSSKNNLFDVRNLSKQELETHARHVPKFKEAQNRLSLFKILRQNFTEWQSFIDELSKPGPRNFDSDHLELHRLLLNYLTATYTISEHFKASYGKRIRIGKDSINEYQKFTETLCANWPEFAFISDYRGYVQHVGLGVEHYHRHEEKDKVALIIEVRPSAIRPRTRDWKKSNLTSESANID